LDGIDRHFNRLLSSQARRDLARILQPVIDAHQAELDLRR
jgi:hypothetical protein